MPLEDTPVKLLKLCVSSFACSFASTVVKLFQIVPLSNDDLPPPKIAPSGVGRALRYTTVLHVFIQLNVYIV